MQRVSASSLRSRAAHPVRDTLREARALLRRRALIGAALALLGSGAGSAAPAAAPWSEAELATLRSLSIDALPPLPPSPGNPVADDPRAVELGHRLFFDTRLGATDRVACATCHQPDKGFRDGLARGRGIGETRRRTMGLVGAAWSPWLFWDGRRDSLWAQALEPLEDPAEHGATRLRHLHLIAGDAAYREAFEALFGELPPLADGARFPPSAGPRGDAAERAAWEAMTPTDRRLVSASFANIGRALEAYQRRLVPAAAPFDEYVRALDAGDAAAASAAMDADQRAGLALFIDKAQCLHCHNGPLFANGEFHNTGITPHDRLPEDRGRVDGVKLLLDDEFNCLGEFSGVSAQACAELDFVKTHGVELVAAFRTPSLRNVAATGGPYMHDGRFDTLREVLLHYDEARPTLISDELQPLELTEIEFDQLEAFLKALDGPLATAPALSSPPRSDGRHSSAD